MLCIYERGRDSLRSVLMGKENVKHLLFNVEELMSKQSPGQFVRTYRVGEKFLFSTWVPMHLALL